MPPAGAPGTLDSSRPTLADKSFQHPAVPLRLPAPAEFPNLLAQGLGTGTSGTAARSVGTSREYAAPWHVCRLPARRAPGPEHRSAPVPGSLPPPAACSRSHLPRTQVLRARPQSLPRLLHYLVKNCSFLPFAVESLKFPRSANRPTVLKHEHCHCQPWWRFSQAPNCTPCFQ